MPQPLGHILLGLALAALALTLVVQVFAARREAAARAAHPPLGVMQEASGHEINVKVMGEGPDIVLIHGSSGSMRDFAYDLAPQIADSFRVFLVDRPGLGWSERAGDESITGQARLIAEAVAAAGARDPLVLGQSYGGAVALAWAVDMPESLSGLVLVSAASHPWDTGLGAYYTVLSSAPGQALVIPAITAFVPDAVVERQVAEVFAPQEMPDGYVARFGPRLSLVRGAMRANARMRAALLDEVTRLSPRYGEIEVPIESLHGTADTIVGLDVHARPLAAQNPNVALTTLPGIGHMPHHVALPEVIAAIRRAALRAGVK